MSFYLNNRMRSFHEYASGRDTALQIANRLGDLLHMPKGSPWRENLADRIERELLFRSAEEVEAEWMNSLRLNRRRTS